MEQQGNDGATPIPFVDHLLVPLDGSPLSEQAIPYALSLIRPGGTMTLLRVETSPEPVRDPLGGTLMTGTEVLARHRLVAAESMVAASKRWRADQRARVEVVIAVGDPVDEILRAAEERAAGLIVMASTGRGAFGRLALGSVADRVARSADIPVAIVRPTDALPDLARPLLRRVLVPLDGSDRSATALPVARTLAKALHASIHLVTVADLGRAAPSALTYGAAFSQEIYDEVMDDLRTQARAGMVRAAAELADAGPAVTWGVLDGSPAEAIIETAQVGDLVVLTSHGRSGFSRWLLGSVAEKLVRHSPAPVVIVPARLAARHVEPARPREAVIAGALARQHVA